MPLTYEWIRRHAADVTAHATSALEAFARVPIGDDAELRDFHIRVASFLVCGVHYSNAALSLSDAGFPGPATALARTVVELDIDVAYILENRQSRKETLARMRRFWAVDELTTIGRLQRAKDRRLPLGDRVDIRALARRRKEILAECPGLTEKKWAVHDLEERARRTNRGPAYRWAYDFGSGALHSGGEAIRYTMTTVKSDAGTVSVEHTSGPRQPRLEPVHHVTVALAQLTQEVSNYLSLGYGSQCREVIEAIMATVKADSESR
jgi:hypothetical protein